MISSLPLGSQMSAGASFSGLHRRSLSSSSEEDLSAGCEFAAAETTRNPYPIGRGVVEVSKSTRIPDLEHDRG